MRFLADGPDIPDDLLDARDEGQVIFFCGAGVSQHEAGGPNFHQLAKLVVEDLGSARGSPARQLLDFAKGVQPIAGVGGMMPADRIFGLLEQEFPSIEVRRAVSRAIRPTADAGFGPHRSLIDLSRTPDGIVRLVTTNFDRIFEQAHPGLRTIDPPVLPDPARPGSLDGIIHLHGKVSLDYVAPESAEFVLSSADFGRAYLADGWATDFIRALMDRYRIVFVGYSADDPPVQYLLEALQPTSAPGRLYALQEGEASLAAGLWQHKGVTAIPFSGFQTLWDSLGAWAERARDPDGWRARIAAMATAGPRSLLPHERGQVANLVSSAIGAETFSRHEPAPPAEWVCVFDPYVRYDRVRPVDVWDAASSDFDPFESYGLDSDPPPRRSEDETMIEQREVPKASWSALEAIATDEPGGRAPAVQSVRGPTASHPPALPKRLFRLARWFGRVATDPIAIWWAAGQNALHPDMLKFAQRDVLQDGVDAAVRNAWRCISAALREPPSDAQDPWILQHAVAIEGWSTLSLQRLLEIERPRLVVLRPTTSPISTPEEARTLVYIDVA
ncbi:MAG: SIR2 family protein, partial [Sphingobium limneticum]